MAQLQGAASVAEIYVCGPSCQLSQLCHAHAQSPASRALPRPLLACMLARNQLSQAMLPHRALQEEIQRDRERAEQRAAQHAAAAAAQQAGAPGPAADSQPAAARASSAGTAAAAAATAGGVAGAAAGRVGPGSPGPRQAGGQSGAAASSAAAAGMPHQNLQVQPPSPGSAADQEQFVQVVPLSQVDRRTLAIQQQHLSTQPLPPLSPATLAAQEQQEQQAQAQRRRAQRVVRRPGDPHHPPQVGVLPQLVGRDKPRGLGSRLGAAHVSQKFSSGSRRGDGAGGKGGKGAWEDMCKRCQAHDLLICVPCCMPVRRPASSRRRGLGGGCQTLCQLVWWM